MEERKCKCCAAPLIRYGADWKCEYCGTVYSEKRERPEILVVEQQPPGSHVLAAEARIDKRMVRAYKDMGREDKMADYTINELTHKLAEGLAGYMRLETSNDPFGEAQIVRGYVRVVDPSFRY